MLPQPTKIDLGEFFPLNKLLATGDIHINSKLFDFEKKRLQHLAHSINKEKPDLIVLNGDIFDKAKPSLEDIKLFYSFLNHIDKDTPIIIISGNHEEITKDVTCFDYLPDDRYIYTDYGYIVRNNYKIWLIGHKNIALLNKGGLPFAKSYKHILFSHYRSSTRFANSEVNNQYVSDNFFYTILSDIHTHYRPYYNIEYTSSPNSIKFEPQTDNGYLLVYFGDKFKTEFIKNEKFNKVKLIIDNEFLKVEEAIRIISSNPTNLYKIVFTYEEDLDIISKIREFNNIYEVSVDFNEKSLINNIDEVVKEIMCDSGIDLYKTVTAIVNKDDLPKSIVEEGNTLIRSVIGAKNE